MNKKRLTQGVEGKLKEIVSSYVKQLIKPFSEKEPPPMNKKLAHEFAEKKLKEVVSSGRERIINLLEEDEHGFISPEGEEYVYMTTKKEGNLVKKGRHKFTFVPGDPTWDGIKKEGEGDSCILVKKGEDNPTDWDPLGEIKYQFKIGAHYGDEESKEVISVWIGVDDGGLSALKPLCRSVHLNYHDLSVYEKEL